MAARIIWGSSSSLQDRDVEPLRRHGEAILLAIDAPLLVAVGDRPNLVLWLLGRPTIWRAIGRKRRAPCGGPALHVDPARGPWRVDECRGPVQSQRLHGRAALIDDALVRRRDVLNARNPNGGGRRSPAPDGWRSRRRWRVAAGAAATAEAVAVRPLLGGGRRAVAGEGVA
eukprot:CAMPEP_0115490362 /NCGR_PEP_ID=MMETSP0271-20121206/62517_1 /TAXON_ID=71861 /ORGANISM="Scrippsiella trochoidea, Strain CCMP3099" /LENGTH=170 /DNA_ID=CAMNT_0002918611 /DNA_START=220 /DNA_END=729 /DNA_ORIENTATION=+